MLSPRTKTGMSRSRYAPIRAKCNHRCRFAAFWRSMGPSGTLAIMPVIVSRRVFLAGAGAAVTAAACGSDDRPRSTGRQIAVANHPLYIDADTNRDFTAATGIAVEYHEEVGDDAQWFEAVRSRMQRNES